MTAAPGADETGSNGELEGGDDEARMQAPHSHASAAGAPGASGPGDPGYDGEATIGDEGAAAGPEAFADPFGRPDTTPDA